MRGLSDPLRSISGLTRETVVTPA